MDTPNDPNLRAKCGVSYNEWFLGEVDKGMGAADRGRLVDRSEVRKLIDQRYPG